MKKNITHTQAIRIKSSSERFILIFSFPFFHTISDLLLCFKQTINNLQEILFAHTSKTREYIWASATCVHRKSNHENHFWRCIVLFWLIYGVVRDALEIAWNEHEMASRIHIAYIGSSMNVWMCMCEIICRLIRMQRAKCAWRMREKIIIIIIIE